jgi:integrase/recombinase XerD
LRANDRPPLLEITDYDVEDHFDAIRGNHPDTTALARHDAITAFFSWVIDNRQRLRDKHDIDIDRNDNPAKGLLEGYANINFTAKKAQVYGEDIIALTREEATKLTADKNIPTPFTRNKLLIKLLLQTGVRASEVTTIRCDDINRDERRIRVRDAKHDRRRTVFYQPSLNRLLQKWLDGGLRETYAYASSSEYLLPTSKSESLSYTAIRRIVDTAAQNAGIQEKLYEDASGTPRWKVTPHTLRHTYARFAVTGENRNGEKQLDVSRLAELMGHQDKEGNPNVTTTKKYLAFREEDLREGSRACIPDI